MVKNNIKYCSWRKFDPPHEGHLYLTLQSLKRLKLKSYLGDNKKNPQKNLFFTHNTKKMCQKLINGHKIKLKHYENN